MESAAGQNIQKKIFNYTRDFVFEKINKKLDEAQAKLHDRQHNRQQQTESNDDEQESTTRITTATEKNYQRVYINQDRGVSVIEESSIGGYRRKSEQIQFIRNEKTRSDRRYPNELTYKRLPITEQQSEDFDDDYQTAEDDDSDVSSVDLKKKYIRYYNNKRRSRRETRSVRDGVILEIPKGYDETDDDKVKKDQFDILGKLKNDQQEKNDQHQKISGLPITTTSPGTPHFPHHGTTPVDYSGYIQKKSLAQGMMDLALVSANTNQLRYILEYQNHHPYFGVSLALVILSLFLQVVVGMTLIWNTRFNVKKRDEMKEADRVNNVSVIGIFMVTLINVFLSTFGGAPQNPANLPSTDTPDSNEVTDEHYSTTPLVYH